MHRVPARFPPPYRDAIVKTTWILALTHVVLMAANSSPCFAQRQTPSEPPPTPVLDSLSFWRVHQTISPPVALVDGELKTFLNGGPWTEWETAAPPADWTQPDFDDFGWPREMVRMTAYSHYLKRICLRGKFEVVDPAKVKGLKISLAYHGGVVVYVNGRELARADLAKGAEWADPYPAEAYLGKDGGLAPKVGIWTARRIDRNDAQRAMRRRTFNDVEIPSEFLRKGVNVVAIEVVRAPLAKEVYDYKLKDGNDTQFRWPTCFLYSIDLTVPAADGLTPNARRPEGFQVWNQNLLASDFVVDWGDRTEALRPLEIVGVRNGAFSGKAMVGSTAPLQDLKATPSALTGPGGTIPASHVCVRYALPWGSHNNLRARSSMGQVDDELGCLSEKSAVDIPLYKSQTSPDLVAGAVTAVWTTINVPRDAKPGDYSGSISIEARGVKPVAVPIRLKVHDWTLPDPQHFNTWVEFLQSPDTLALEYDTPLWSDRHWELIGQSFKLLSDSGSRAVYIPLVAETNLGNSESMVRWIKKGENQYEYDFSVMDKYLDAAEKNLGPLKMVVLFSWEAYMIQKEGFQGRGYHKEFMEKSDRFSSNHGPVVTVLDPTTGKTENVIMPYFSDPASKALWKPLFDRIRERLARRGLEKKTMIGMMNDGCPSKDDVAFFADIAPDMPWAVAAHDAYMKAQFGYQALVYCETAKEKSLMGWKRPDMLAYFHRGNTLDGAEPAFWRTMPSFAVAGVWRGVGHLGGDFWKVFRDKKGQRSSRVYSRYPQSNWRNLDIYTSFLAPMPDGLVRTTRYEHLREGVQECEARIAVEQAIADAAARSRLGDELAARCEKALMEHLRALQMCRGAGQKNIHALSGETDLESFWFRSSGWEKRAEQLFILAGEAEARRGAKP